MTEHTAESDAHRCATPPEAMPGDEWTCPECGLAYWADDTEETWGEGTFEWRVIPPAEAECPSRCGRNDPCPDPWHDRRPIPPAKPERGQA